MLFISSTQTTSQYLATTKQHISSIFAKSSSASGLQTSILTAINVSFILLRQRSSAILYRQEVLRQNLSIQKLLLSSCSRVVFTISRFSLVSRAFTDALFGVTPLLLPPLLISLGATKAGCSSLVLTYVQLSQSSFNASRRPLSLSISILSYLFESKLTLQIV